MDFDLFFYFDFMYWEVFIILEVKVLEDESVLLIFKEFVVFNFFYKDFLKYLVESNCVYFIYDEK